MTRGLQGQSLGGGRLLLWCLALAASSSAQEGARTEFDRKNTWTLMAEYANTSSHIVLGQSRQRRLATLGGGYTRRVARFWGSEIGYRVELRPVVFESDPVQIRTETDTSASGTGTTSSSMALAGVCRPYTVSGIEPLPPPIGDVSYSVQVTCGRQWTFGQIFSPIGFQYITGVRHAWQPYVVGTLGYMYTSRPIPVANAESFNFVPDLGVGVQVFRSENNSVGVEGRLRHISNRNTAQSNPGIDQITFGVSYSFGR